MPLPKGVMIKISVSLMERKNISQLALPNCSLINGRNECIELLAKLGCHKEKAEKGHRFHDLYPCQAETSMVGLTGNQSRYSECSSTNKPEHVFVLPQR